MENFSLTNLKGIGAKSEKALNERGIFSYNDIKSIIPSKFYVPKKKKSFSENENAILFEATIVGEPKTSHIGKMSITRAKAKDKSGAEFTVKWFNQSYVAKQLKQSESYLFFGNTSKTEMTVVLFKPKSKQGELEGPYPIYKKYGIKRNQLQSAIRQALQIEKHKSIIPPEIESKFDLQDLHFSYETIHSPKTVEEKEKALRRIEMEQAVLFLQEKQKNELQNRKTRPGIQIDKKLIEKQKSLLPFELTKSQNNVLQTLVEQVQGTTNLNHLVQGDVGSGKTIVAFLLALAYVNAGFQVAIMAPTEILAKQHIQTFEKFFGNIASTELLTSKMKVERTNARSRQIVFGTHILAEIQYENLGLVIIDEQHRFGVEQRAKLIQKSKTKDTLLLSATPIPRSLNLTLLGNLDSSRLDGRPFKNNTKTHIVSADKEDDMWKFVKGSSSKVFVVCPRIFEDDDDPFEKSKLSSTEEMTAFLKKKFGSETVQEITGKKDDKQIERALQKFSKGTAKFLVATTIIEVGIDIPEANIMIIHNPERFGLATLHQLRGRIGRDGRESFCFILAKNLSHESAKRIKFFKNNNDGFEIAEFDFLNRGGGEVQGTAQHGNVQVAFSLSILNEAKQIFDQLSTKSPHPKKQLSNN